MISRIYCASLAFLISVLAAGCGIVPYRTAANSPLCQTEDQICQKTTSTLERARIDFDPDDANFPKAFVGIALSGGGSRAANFSMAAFQNLDEMGLLRHVTAISSVSGGGLAAAYYVLNGPTIDWQRARDLMATDFLGRWAIKLLQPQNLLSLTFTHEDRSDLMADVFDDVLFNGATYADLGAFSPGRPRFLANATNAGTGNRFPFEEGNFRSYLGARLDSYPISNAVMASAAFPGIFNDVTLKRYLRDHTEYVHLLDGGPSDNLGVESLLQMVARYQKMVMAKSEGKGTPAPCLLIAVDAYPEPEQNRNANMADPRRAFDYLVDSNFMDAFDVLLSRRRLDMLQRMGLGPASARGGRANPSSYAEYRMLDEGMTYFTPNIQIVTFNYPLDHTGYVWRGMIPGDAEQINTPKSDAIRTFQCTVWHLNLSATSDTEAYVGEPGETPERIDGTKFRFSQFGKERSHLDWLARQIKTNFKLTGPKNCSPAQIQSAIYASALALTRQDYANVQRICKWFEGAGLEVDDRCRYFPGSAVSIPASEVQECLIE